MSVKNKPPVGNILFPRCIRRETHRDDKQLAQQLRSLYLRVMGAMQMVSGAITLLEQAPERMDRLHWSLLWSAAPDFEEAARDLERICREGTSSPGGDGAAADLHHPMAGQPHNEN